MFLLSYSGKIRLGDQMRWSICYLRVRVKVIKLCVEQRPTQNTQVIQRRNESSFDVPVGELHHLLCMLPSTTQGQTLSVLRLTRQLDCCLVSMRERLARGSDYKSKKSYEDAGHANTLYSRACLREVLRSSAVRNHTRELGRLDVILPQYDSSR